MSPSPVTSEGRAVIDMDTTTAATSAEASPAPVAPPVEVDNGTNEFLEGLRTIAAQISINLLKSLDTKEKSRLRREKEAADESDTVGGSGRKRKATPSSNAKKSKKAKVEPVAVAADSSVIELDLSEITATLKDYQLYGVTWLATLDEMGASGILADEMGLGKTLQAICFISHMRSKKVAEATGVTFIVCPKSVISSWKDECDKFCPTLPILVYQGTPAERATMRRERLGFKLSENAQPDVVKEPPIILTSYDILNNDVKFLKKMRSSNEKTNKFVRMMIVDEAHRLKNNQCKFLKTLRDLPSETRLLLTGTPLQNNLPELFSLLSYISPDYFSNFATFIDSFDTQSVIGDAKFTRVQQMRAILEPFMLRRVKKDVEKSLPLLKQYVLTAPLTARQNELYEATLKKEIRSLLISEKVAPPEIIVISDDEEDSIPLRRSRAAAKGKGKARKTYEEEEDDDDFVAAEEKVDPRSVEQQGLDFQRKEATRKANSMRLGNPMMSLRKIANHPYLLDREPMIDEKLLSSSGKMMLLNRLLDGLFEKGHKVLLFSQFTETLDLIQDWTDQIKKIPTFRLDGQTSSEDRRQFMKDFNEGTGPDSINLFLLSTRAGGEGITLLGADTVILFDSDWNPSKDLQAMARCHRIGQTKPVLVFRLVSAGTIETTLLERAGEKRTLEGLVIGDEEDQAGIVDKAWAAMNGKRRSKAAMSIEQLASIAAKRDAEDIVLSELGDEILSDAQLELLLDRSVEAMRSDNQWLQKAKKVDEKSKAKAAFTVFIGAEEEYEAGEADEVMVVPGVEEDEVEVDEEED